MKRLTFILLIGMLGLSGCNWGKKLFGVDDGKDGATGPQGPTGPTSIQTMETGVAGNTFLVADNRFKTATTIQVFGQNGNTGWIPLPFPHGSLNVHFLWKDNDDKITVINATSAGLTKIKVVFYFT